MPNAANNSHKLFDAGWSVELSKCPLGSYSAVARKQGQRPVITDGFDATEALNNITDKVLGLGALYTAENIRKLKEIGGYYADEDEDHAGEEWKND